MNIKEFATKVAGSVEVALKEVEKVEVKKVKKNNETLTALIPHKEGLNVSPTIYMEGWYEQYQEGMEFEDIIYEFCDLVDKLLKDNKKNNEMLDIANKYKDYENYTRQRLKLCLVNKEKNKELLYEVPHIDILDLAVIVRSIVGDGMSITVKKSHLTHWGISKERLFADAKNGPVETLTYHGYIADRLMMCELFDGSDINVNELPYDIYRNNSNFNATASLFINPSETLSRYKEDVYVVPKSVHDALIVKPECAKPEVIEGVKESIMPIVNTGFLESDEFLSDNLYIYRQATGELEIVEGVA